MTSDVRSPGRWGWERVAVPVEEQEPPRRGVPGAGRPEVQRARGGPSLTLESFPFVSLTSPGGEEGSACCAAPVFGQHVERAAFVPGRKPGLEGGPAVSDTWQVRRAGARPPRALALGCGARGHPSGLFPSGVGGHSLGGLWAPGLKQFEMPPLFTPGELAWSHSGNSWRSLEGAPAYGRGAFPPGAGEPVRESAGCRRPRGAGACFVPVSVCSPRGWGSWRRPPRVAGVCAASVPRPGCAPEGRGGRDVVSAFCWPTRWEVRADLGGSSGSGRFSRSAGATAAKSHGAWRRGC